MKKFTVVPISGPPFDVSTNEENPTVRLEIDGSIGVGELVFLIGYRSASIFRAAEVVGIYEKITPEEETP